MKFKGETKMSEIWDYLSEEQKQKVAETCFDGFIEAINSPSHDNLAS